MSPSLIQPHGGKLVQLLVDEGRRQALWPQLVHWPSWTLTPRQLCDLELLACGAFSPLTGFLTEEDYRGVVARMRLTTGLLWPVPVTLDVPQEVAESLAPGQPLVLRDAEGLPLGILHVHSRWQPDREEEARLVYGTSSREHPGVRVLLEDTHPYCLGGPVEVLQLPVHYDFTHLRLSPPELRREFLRRGWKRVVAFQTRNPMHRAHVELTLHAAKQAGASVLIHPVVGLTKPGDVDHYTRVRCYQALLPHYPPGMVMLALLPLAMRLAGPREALWHAIIRKNYGCSHFIVGRDHAGPGTDGQGRPFYEPYAAQELVARFQEELGIQMLPFKNMVYVEELEDFVEEDQVPPGFHVRTLSGTHLRTLLAQGKPIPPWFTYPEVEAELRRTYPPRARQGFTVFFTGLSGAGKSTLARLLQIKLLEIGGRSVTLLDGDLVRKHLSSELGFSKRDRDINIRRIGFVAAEITKAGGVALCAPIAPYDAVRKEIRQEIGQYGGFILVYVCTPLAVCEARDRKGLYAKARAGLIAEFTGISDPYEPPEDAELVIDTSQLKPEEAVHEILLYLEREGYIGPGADRLAATP
ncbi:MAG: bifunctional sulfate adenylyltransferase/adenylylsulfate kinase [Thermoanaerobaculum sp.]|nr:bifunctional sulfate adenylyltransferase/adenylylsulfate kinase [Thermoanaerobaculum sp.]